MKLDLDSIKKNLMIKYPLFGSILANTKFVEDDSVGTAGTDGDTIYYSPTFLSGLNEKEQTFVLAHEICHIAFDHVFRSEGKDKRLWNIATDAVINALLQHDGLPLVGDGVNIPEAVNYNAEQMYEKLFEETRQNQNENKMGNSNQKDTQSNKSQNSSDNNLNSSQTSDSSQSNNSQNLSDNNQSSSQTSDSGQSNNNQKSENGEENNKNGSDSDNFQEKSSEKSKQINSHDMWEKAVEKRKRQNYDFQEEKSKEYSLTEKEKHIRKLSTVGEAESFEKNKIARKKQLEELMDSIADQSHGVEKGTNRDIIDVGDIGESKPLIEWRMLLKEAIKFDSDWSYSNATIEEGVIVPHLEELPLPVTEIVIDTSGSIDTNLLRNFLKECKNIMKSSKVKVGCFDEKFYGFTEIRNMRDIDNIKFIGGGGTNFNVAVNAFTRRVENKIIFTDGRAKMPDVSMDVIWIVFGETKIHPRGGKVIYINEKELKKLRLIENPKLKR